MSEYWLVSWQEHVADHQGVASVVVLEDVQHSALLLLLPFLLQLANA